MGIQNLLPFVKKALRRGNVEEMRGQTVAVDASCWLHRGIFGCCEKLVQGQSTDFYVQYCLKYVRLLRKYDIHVILVFDGQSLPAKESVNEERRQRRKKWKEQGLRLLRQGKAVEEQCLERATEITFDIIRDVILACRRLEKVDWMVAPYESDAQLTFLCQQGIAQAVITEDSDLIPFGCPKIFFKLDQNGFGDIFECSQLAQCMSGPLEKFSFERFRRVCILSGCDYLPEGFPGVGLTKADRFFAKTSQSDLKIVLRKIPMYLNMPNANVTEEFIEDFIRAENTFLHQLVFDPRTSKVLPLNPYPEEDRENFPYAGSMPHCLKIAREKALGNLHPKTLHRVDHFKPDTGLGAWSIWHRDFKPGREQRRRSPRKQQTTAFQSSGRSRVLRASPRSPWSSSPKKLPQKELLNEELLRIYGISAEESATEVVSSPEEQPEGSRKRRSQYFETEESSGVSPAARNPFRAPRLLQSPPTKKPRSQDFLCDESPPSSPDNTAPCSVFTELRKTEEPEAEEEDESPPSSGCRRLGLSRRPQHSLSDIFSSYSFQQKTHSLSAGSSSDN